MSSVRFFLHHHFPMHMLFQLKQSSLVILGIIIAGSWGCSPSARFTYTQERQQAPSEVKFDNASMRATEYEWDFGDGQTATEESPHHQFVQSGEYAVTLKAMKGSRTSTTTQKIMIDPVKNAQVAVDTDFGTMIIQLSDATPGHRDNFLKLVSEGFYEDLLFHRVIQEFMVQGGDPNSRGAKPGQMLGSGGPGYQIPAEFVDTLYHVKGAVAAARTGDQVNPEKKSSGSQFYIVHGRSFSPAELDQLEGRMGRSFSDEQRALYREDGGAPFLDGEYTVFGMVIKGLEVIDNIAAGEVDRGNRPLSDIRMKMRILEENEKVTPNTP